MSFACFVIIQNTDNKSANEVNVRALAGPWKSLKVLESMSEGP